MKNLSSLLSLRKMSPLEINYKLNTDLEDQISLRRSFGIQNLCPIFSLFLGAQFLLVTTVMKDSLKKKVSVCKDCPFIKKFEIYYDVEKLLLSVK